MEALIKNIEEDVKLSNVVKKDLRKSLTMHQLSKKNKVVKDGRLSNKLFFVKEGVVRSYLNQDDKEITTWIYYSGQVFASWDSFINQKKSNETIEVVTDSILVSIDYEELQTLFKKHPALDQWGRKLMEKYTIHFNQFNQQMRFASAKERYEYFLSKFPNEPKVKLGYVASFLGITQETLSRIRRNSGIKTI